MRLECKNLETLLQVAQGNKKADLAITNCNMVNVITGSIDKVIVYVSCGFIAHVEFDNLNEEINSEKIYDAKGQYLVPGLMDPHVHIESSMMTPRNFAKAVLNHGTTTVITDPHEIGNVFGVPGVQYMHDSALDLPMRQYVNAPSCIPSVPNLECSGAEIFAEDIKKLSQLENIIGLGEVMSYIDVIAYDKKMHDILKEAKKQNLYLQGHAPFLTGRKLSAYLCAGPNTCHETRESFEAMDKFRRGMFIDARESSISKNIKDILDGIRHYRYFDHLCLCTDDRESDDILKKGHINDVVRVAIRHGMHPIDAIRSVTYNVAREINISNIGAIAPGFVADMVIIDNLADINAKAVFHNGNLVSENGKLTVEIKDKSFEIENINSINIGEITESDLKIKAPIENGEITINCMTYRDLLTSFTTYKKATVNVKNGFIDLSNQENLNFVVVINRYGKNNIALSVVENFGINKGCVASTVSHDSHNLTIVFKDINDALIAINKLKNVGGGMVSILDGKILHTLQLKVGGIISTKTAEELRDDVEKMKEANISLGLVEIKNPLLRIVTLALPVIPNVKMSDIGMIDVNKKTFINLFE
ncbi:MAG: adenine deaminase [Oscillospiraceae bacterium]